MDLFDDTYSKKILGTRVDYNLTLPTSLQRIEDLIKSGGSHLVATTSPYFIMAAQEDEEFRKLINDAALSTPDGIGVLFAKYYLEKVDVLKKKNLWRPLFICSAFITGVYCGFTGFIDRKRLGVSVTGVELTDKLCELAANRGYTVFFLGGRPRDSKGEGIVDPNYDMAKEASKVMQEKYPALNVIGASSQFNRNEKDDARTRMYMQECMQEHNVTSIDILFVAYAPVYQEKWFLRNSAKVPIKVTLGIGRTLDYVTNSMKKAPRLVSRLGMEWLYSLLVQPWRFSRVFLSFPAFPIKVFLSSIR